MNHSDSLQHHRATGLLADLQARYQHFIAQLPPSLRDLASQPQTYYGPPVEGIPTETREKPPAALRLPWLFWSLFSEVPDDLFLMVAEGGAFYFLASILLDHLVDGEASDPGAVALLQRAFWLHGTACFRAVFPGDSPFWGHHDRLLAEHQAGLVAEQQALSDPESFNQARLIKVASSKICPGLVSLAGLAQLNNAGTLLEILEGSLKDFAVGTQFIDDVQDWRIDLAAGHLTHFLTCTAPPTSWKERPWHLVATIEANIHATMVDLDHWKLGVSHFTQAIQSVQHLLCPGWTDYVYEARRVAQELWDQASLRHLLRAIESLLVKSDTERYPVSEENLPAVMPPIKTGPSSAIHRSLQALLEAQYPDGSWRDYDIPGLGVSDTWITAHVGLKLASLPDAYRNPELGAALVAAADFLAGKWHHGWGYNDHAPVDADTTAHTLLFFKKFGCNPPASTVPALLEFQRPDGGFATYDRFRDPTMPQSWCTPHPDVTPLVVHALLVTREGAGPDRSVITAIDDAITAALPHLEADRLPGGNWPAFWWVLHWYTTAAWLETIKTMRSLKWMQRALPTVRWPEAGPDFYSCTSKLDEALLLVCALGTGETKIASQAADRLVAAQQADGLWPIEPALCQTTPGVQRPWELSTRETLYPETTGLYSAATIAYALGWYVHGFTGKNG